MVFARDYTTAKNSMSTKEEKLDFGIFFFEPNNQFFVAFVRFVVKSIRRFYLRDTTLNSGQLPTREVVKQKISEVIHEF